MKNLELGQKISFNKVYRSASRYEHDKFTKRWNEVDISPTLGVFVGYRILREGSFDWETNITSKYIKAALVAKDKRGLLYVPINSI